MFQLRTTTCSPHLWNKQARLRSGFQGIVYPGGTKGGFSHHRENGWDWNSFLFYSYLVDGFTPFEKYAQVKLDHFPKFRGEHKKYLSCHHLVIHASFFKEKKTPGQHITLQLFSNISRPSHSPSPKIHAWIQRVALGLVLIRPEAAAVQGQILFFPDGLRSGMQHFYGFSTPVVQKTFRYIPFMGYTTTGPSPSVLLSRWFSFRWDVGSFPRGYNFSKVIQHLNFKLKMPKVLRKRPKIWNQQLVFFVFWLGSTAQILCICDTKIHPKTTAEGCTCPKWGFIRFSRLGKTRWNWGSMHAHTTCRQIWCAHKSQQQKKPQFLWTKIPGLHLEVCKWTLFINQERMNLVSIGTWGFFDTIGQNTFDKNWNQLYRILWNLLVCERLLASAQLLIPCDPFALRFCIQNGNGNLLLLFSSTSQLPLHRLLDGGFFTPHNLKDVRKCVKMHAWKSSPKFFGWKFRKNLGETTSLLHIEKGSRIITLGGWTNPSEQYSSNCIISPK